MENNKQFLANVDKTIKFHEEHSRSMSDSYIHLPFSMLKELRELSIDLGHELNLNQIEIKEYKKAINTALESEPQGDEDWEILLNGLKSYLQGVLDGNF